MFVAASFQPTDDVCNVLILACHSLEIMISGMVFYLHPEADGMI